MSITEPSSPILTQDERVMAALAHGAAFLPFMGVIAPIIIWATQKDKSPYVAFQALQAVAYQLTMILAWFIGMACYMCSFFVTFFGAFTTMPLALTPAEEPDLLTGLLLGISVLSFLIPFIIFGLIFIGGLLFVVGGIIAALSTLQGKDFRYPILGARLERYLQRS